MMNTRNTTHGLLVAVMVTAMLWTDVASAAPIFARQYNLTCAACHSAVPRLNEFGESFAANNFRLANWKDTILNIGDDRLALPKVPPLAIRAQGYIQMRDGEEIGGASGPTGADSSFDFQSPYLIKLLSSAPLSDNITFYFYGIFAEKGGNGETVIEDAWFSYSDIAGSGISSMLGQFQVSDLMFPRETRLTFQDFYIYRAAGITYDRGVILDRGFGALDFAIGAVNGNGISAHFDLNSPGYNRPDNLFDNDTQKSWFTRLGTSIGPVSIGLFGLDGEQKSAAGFAGADVGNRDTSKRIVGIDLSGNITPTTHWFAQALVNRWGRFLDAAPGVDYKWSGTFIGVDYIPNDRWAFSFLHNYAQADDFDGTGTIYEGIDMNSLTVGVSYYFMRNVRAVLEVNVDLLGEDPIGPPFVGHQSKEHYVLFGFDVAY